MEAILVPGSLAGVNVDAEAPMPEADPAQFTIDELAAESRVPSRTIRFYQSKGVLPPPEIKGRVAFYGPPHLERLRLIANLQDRGLRIDAIRALLARVDGGEVDVVEWLGLDAQLKASWANDQPRMMSEAEVRELAGSDRAGLIGDLVRLGAVRRTGDMYLVRSPALLQVAMRLEAAGVDLETALESEAILRKNVGRAARELAKLFLSRAEAGNVTPPADGDWARLLGELRPTGIEAVRLVFGQEMERVLRELIESGATAKLPTRRKKRKPTG
jgi:DNA-binding transcriptional MerR regulator